MSFFVKLMVTMKMRRKISFSILSAVMILSSQSVFSNTQADPISQEQQQEAERRSSSQQDILPDQADRYEMNQSVKGDNSNESAVERSKPAENQNRDVSFEKRDSVEDDSVSKYNFIFYFLYKYKYDQD